MEIKRRTRVSKAWRGERIRLMSACLPRNKRDYCSIVKQGLISDIVVDNRDLKLEGFS